MIYFKNDQIDGKSLLSRNTGVKAAPLSDRWTERNTHTRKLSGEVI